MTMTRQLAREMGLLPLATFQEWGDLLALAESIELTIQMPLVRASFVVSACADLQNITPAQAETTDIGYYLEESSNARPTPQGATELWGSAMQEVKD